MRLSSLITMFCSCLTLTALSAASINTIEVKAGLMPFTVYMKGSIRLHYNIDSKISGIAYYDDLGLKYATQDWSYDAYGTVARKEICQSIGWFNTRSSVFTYQYSATNRVLEENQCYNNWENRQLKYHYNLFGELDKLQAFNTTYSYLFPTEKESVQNIYTIDGKLDSRIFFNSNGKRTLTQKWSYDYLGRTSEFQTFDGNGNLVWGTQYAYDASLGCDIETQFGPYREVLSYIYTYRNDLGQVFERDLRDAAAGVITLTMIDYNLFGQVIRVADYDSSNAMIGLISTFYDAQTRPYQHDFSYQDSNILRDRIQDYLKLAGNDL